jgi:predicted Fe-S protein YdhL (DUF1289 family)
MITPCVRLCRLEDGVCIGCKRTTEEISKWFWMDDKEKMTIMDNLKNR